MMPAVARCLLPTAPRILQRFLGIDCSRHRLQSLSGAIEKLGGRAAPAPDPLCGRTLAGGSPVLKSALLVSAGIDIGVGSNAVLAQNITPYIQVAQINVIDQKATR